MASKPASNSFEASLKQLEDIVESLEKGDMPLEDSLKSFEKGIELTRTCQKALREAEQKVEMLSAEPESGTSSDES